MSDTTPQPKKRLQPHIIAEKTAVAKMAAQLQRELRASQQAAAVSNAPAIRERGRV